MNNRGDIKLNSIKHSIKTGIGFSLFIESFFPNISAHILNDITLTYLTILQKENEFYEETIKLYPNNKYVGELKNDFMNCLEKLK